MYEILPDPEPTKVRKHHSLKLPKIRGRYGISFMVGSKDVFFGFEVGELEVTVGQRRRLKLPKNGVRVAFID